MSGVTYTVRGEAELIHSLRNGPARLRRAFRRASNNAGKILVSAAQSGMASAGGGRVYNGIAAGAPGGFAANRSGKLSGSFSFKATPTGLTFGTSLSYGGYLETGTGRMPARPNVKLAAEKSRAAVDKEFVDGVAREMNRR